MVVVVKAVVKAVVMAVTVVTAVTFDGVEFMTHEMTRCWAPFKVVLCALVVCALGWVLSGGESVEEGKRLRGQTNLQLEDILHSIEFLLVPIVERN